MFSSSNSIRALALFHQLVHPVNCIFLGRQVYAQRNFEIWAIKLNAEFTSMVSITCVSVRRWQDTVQNTGTIVSANHLNSAITETFERLIHSFIAFFNLIFHHRGSCLCLLWMCYIWLHLKCKRLAGDKWTEQP